MKTSNLKTIVNWIPVVLSLVGAMLLLTSLFLPYAAAVDTYAEWLNENPEYILDTKTMTKAHELVGISMFEFAGIYSRLDGYFICTAIVYIIAGCSLLSQRNPCNVFLVALNRRHFASQNRKSYG